MHVDSLLTNLTALPSGTKCIYFVPLPPPGWGYIYYKGHWKGWALKIETKQPFVQIHLEINSDT
jgi:hypothetical protein